MPRTLLVGFDGAVLDLAERWMTAGRLPVLAGICRDGSYGTLRSTFPYNSAVAWTTLSTGASPGRHGIFDFVLPRRGEYRLRVATREDRRVPALWSHATRAGARVGILNIPVTFPAEPLNGFMVSGMDAPRLDHRAVHPARFLDELHRLAPDYRILSNAAAMARKGDFEAAERELVDTMVARSRFACELGRSRDLDLIMVNLEATDGAQHFFWQHHDASHTRHDAAAAHRWGDTIGRVYEATDGELGRLIDAYAPDTVFVVSDHGGGPSNDWVIFMNDWLAEEGFLRFRARGRSATRRLYGELRGRLPVPIRRRLRSRFGAAVDRARESALYGDVDWSGSRAYAQMQSGVRLNLVGREPNGSVQEGDRETVLGDLVARADALRMPGGERAFGTSVSPDHAHPGDAPGGWDLILETTPGLHVRSRNTTAKAGFLHRLRDIDMYLPSGVHTPVGLVAAAGSNIDRRGRVEESDIRQVAPSVLAAMGVPAPPLDGDPFAFVTSPLVSTGPAAEPEALGSDLDAGEEDEVLERLRGLGYVD